MKRALLILAAVISMTGCAVRAGYYSEPYGHHYHYRYRDSYGYWHEGWR